MSKITSLTAGATGAKMKMDSGVCSVAPKLYSSRSRRTVVSSLLAGVALEFASRNCCAAEINYDINQVRDTIARDMQDEQYYITGNLTSDIYEANCFFKDPAT